MTGYSGYLGDRTATTKGFRLLAATSPTEIPQKLTDLIGQVIGIGHVSVGTQLKLKHNFMRYTEEVPGHEEGVSYDTLEFPGQLEQAYLGDSDDFPLFAA